MDYGILDDSSGRNERERQLEVTQQDREHSTCCLLWLVLRMWFIEQRLNKL